MKKRNQTGNLNIILLLISNNLLSTFTSGKLCGRYFHSYVILLFTLLCSFTFELNAQVHDKPIEFELKNQTLEQGLQKLSKTAGLKLNYSVNQVNRYQHVSVEKNRYKLERLLQLLLNNTTLTYKIVDTNIIILEKKTSTKNNKTTEVKGKVLDNNKQAIIGATVKIKGSDKGTITNSTGEFAINATPDDILSFSYIGMKSRDEMIGERSEIITTLEDDSQMLNEVNIISNGYQNLNIERATGAYSKVDKEQLAQRRLSDLKTILEGLVVGYTGGQFRGVTSMLGSVTPLIVIDGFPVENTRYESTGGLIENMPNLNLEDIESVTVLKDATATSIYGARAANGVIVIVTRKASKPKTEISISSTLTISPKKVYTDNLTSASDIINLEKGWVGANPNLSASANSVGMITDPTVNSYASSLIDNAVYTSTGMRSLLSYYAGKTSQSMLNATLNELTARGYQYYKDVEKYTKRNQVYQQYNLNIGKANGKNSFNSSITYKKNNYNDLYSSDNSIGINVRNSTELTKWLTLDLGTYNYYSGKTTQTYNPLSPGYAFQAYDQLVDNAGNNVTSTAESRLSRYTLDNISKYGLCNMDITPIEELGRNLRKTNSFSNRTYVKLKISFADYLKYSTMFQYEYGKDMTNLLKDKNSYSVRSTVNGLVSISSEDKAVYHMPYGNIMFNEFQELTGYNLRHQLEFDKTLNNKHDVSFLIGNEVRESKLLLSNNTYYNYDSEMLSYSPVNQSELISTYGMSATDFSTHREQVNRFVSLYGNAGYSYNDRYLLNGSIRWDRSNLWGTDKKYQNKPTWSVGGGWNLSKEPFFTARWVDQVKLRLTYGLGGNISKNSAPYMTASYSSNNNIGGMQGYINSRPNPTLSWEKTTTINMGTDFSLFKGRLSGAIDLYKKNGTNLLAHTMGVPTEGWGYSTYTINNGEMINKGIELTLNGTVIKTKDFSWNLSFLYAYNKNEVTYINVTAPIYVLQLDYPEAYPRVGKSLNTIYGYKWAGLSSKGLPQVYDKDHNPTSSNPADLDAIVDCGSAVPVYNGSIQTSFSYKNLNLSCLFVYQGGYKMRNTNLPILNSIYSSATYSYMPIVNATNKNINNSWKKAGDELITNVPRVMYGFESDYSSDLSDIYRYADINIVDASHITLSNVSLSYKLPDSFIKKLSMEHAQFNFNIENLYMFAANQDAKYLLGGFVSPNFVFGLNVAF